jgi:hypothetical protein
MGRHGKGKAMIIERVFLDHPHRVNENFFEHMCFALTFSGRLFKAAAAAFLHALVPALCETTASQAIMEMHAEIAARRAQMAKSEGFSAPAATPSYHGRDAAGSSAS